jgi:putative transposase
MDDTHIRMKGDWRYPYPAVDKYGEAADLLRTGRRDKEAALRFLKKLIRRHGAPETITIDGRDADEAAIKSYHQEHGTAIQIRQAEYLNDIVEQDGSNSYTRSRHSHWWSRRETRGLRRQPRQP